MRKTLLASLLVVAAMLPCGASADQALTGAMDIGFASAKSSGVTANDWSGGLAALFSFDNPGMNIQVSGSYDHIDASGTSVNLWTAEGDVFWRDRKGTIGLSVGHGEIGAGASVTSYGAFGEWYATSDVTLRLKGGGFNGSGSGGYGGVGIEYYPIGDLGLSLAYNYTGVGGGHVHDIGVTAEYLISRDYPLSVAVGYNHSSTTGADANAFMIAIRYRFGMEGSLVRLDRTGPISWNGLVSR